jgi:hypothetical protein
MQFTVIRGAIDESKPLIYMWEIREHSGKVVGRYVGKAKAGSKRPLTHYTRNVRNILAGKPYRRLAPAGFRRIHLALANAVRDGLLIELTLLVNVPEGASINEHERGWIKAKECVGPAAWQLND